MRKLALALVLAPWLAASPAAAGPSVTIYTHDLGFVRETRAFDMRSARDTVRLEDVSSRLDFSSVRLAPSSGRVERLAYRFDTEEPDALLEHATGRHVRLACRENRVVEGTLVAAGAQWLVVRDEDGTLHSVAREAVEDAQLAGGGRPLAVKPAIEAVLEGARGHVEAELSYLTGGLSWTAEHTLVRTGENSATWGTVVVVENTTGRAYEDARLKLVAGEPSRVAATPVPPRPFEMRAMAAAALPADAMQEQAFADYHLYTLEQPATLRDRESQSLVMYSPRPLKVTPRYVFRGASPQGVTTQLEIVNSAREGPGVPLPAGRVRCFANDPEGALQFTGETQIAHTAVDEKLTLDMGLAFDLVAERRTLAEKRTSDRERETTIEIRLRNRKPTAVRISVEEPVPADAQVLEQSQASVRKDATTLVFDVDVPAGQETAVRYTIRQRW